MIFHLIKGGIFASLYFFFFWHCFAGERASARVAQLSERIEWQALLHASGRHSHIRDSRFFLSDKGASDPAAELLATLQAFQQNPALGNAHPICRFPARFRWLRKELALPRARFPEPSCTQYQEFLDKVPVASIALVFASENVTSPSSMMGHTFLKLSGLNGEGRSVAHAVTYFTVLDSYNVPKIVYQNFAGGMPGYFALQPYRKLKHNYLQKEHRNIWEYRLRLSDEQKQLIRDHVWELKDMKSDYLFAEYNCATLTWYFMQLIAPEHFRQYRKPWVSPIDVVKVAGRTGLIDSTQVITSNHWKLQMLLDQTGMAGNKLRNQLMHISAQDADTYVRSLTPGKRLLVLSYLEYLEQNNLPDREQTPAFRQIRQQLARQTSDYQLDYTDYKQPTKVPGNAQVRMEAGRSSRNGAFLGLSLLPAANRLTDDQRQFFSATELRLAEVAVRLYEGSKFRLERLTLYAMKSLSPWNGLTKNISGQWQTGLERQPDAEMNDRLVYSLSGGIGYTVNLGADVLLYGLYNLGVAADFSRAYIYHYPEIGLQIDEIFNMKTSVSYEARFNSYGSSQRVDQFHACQSYYPGEDFTWLVCYQSSGNRSHGNDEASLLFQAHF